MKDTHLTKKSKFYHLFNSSLVMHGSFWDITFKALKLSSGWSIRLLTVSLRVALYRADGVDGPPEMERS